MYGGKRELANVGLKMEDKRDLVILTPCPSPQTATEPTPHTCVIKNIETLWLRSNSAVEMKMFTHRSLKKTAEGNLFVEHPGGLAWGSGLSGRWLSCTFFITQCVSVPHFAEVRAGS